MNETPGTPDAPTSLRDAVVEPLAANRQIVHDWLKAHYFSGAHGMVAVCSTRNWTGIQTSSLDEAVQWVMREDAAGVQGIYARVTTVNRAFPAGSRGAARDSYALLDMWSDLDFGDGGHKTTGLPKDAAEAGDIPVFAGLPPATEIHNSGGGLYDRWTLDQPVIIGEDIEFAAVVQLAADFQNILLIGAKKLGVGYGTGVKDLARVLRIPGTVNRKPGRMPALCRITQTGGPRYTLAELQEIVARLRPAPPEKKTPRPAAARPAAGSRKSSGRFNRPGPLEILGEHAVCGDIIEFAGATYAEQYPGSCSYCGGDCQRWNRPGWGEGNSVDGIAVHKGGAAITVRTDNFPGLDPAAVGRVLSSGQLFAALHHRGDESEAAKDILRAAHDRPEATGAARALPLAVLAAVREVSGPTIRTGFEDILTPEDQAAARQKLLAAGMKRTATQPRTYVHPAKRLRGLVAKVAGASEDDAAGLLRWAARNGFAVGREAAVEPKAIADAFRRAAVRAGLDNDLAMTIIRTSYQEVGK